MISFVSKGFPYRNQNEELLVVMVYCTCSQHVTQSTFALISLFNCNILFKDVPKVLLNPNQSVYATSSAPRSKGHRSALTFRVPCLRRGDAEVVERWRLKRAASGLTVVDSEPHNSIRATSCISCRQPAADPHHLLPAVNYK